VQNGEVEEVAGPLVDSVEKGDPDSPVILETLARAFMHRLRYRSALACLTRWIEIRPDSARAHHWRGWVLERLGRNHPAAEDYRRSLELDPNSFRVRLRVAEMYLEDRQAPEALPHLQRLYRQAPQDPEVQARLGVCLYLLNQRDKARQLMESAVRRRPNDPSLLNHLAKLDLEQGKAAEAERRLRTILKADPADTEALHNLVSALQFQGRGDEAASALEAHKKATAQLDRANKLLQQVADSPSATAADYAELGDLLLRLRRAREGVYWLEQALERNRGELRAHAALADHYEKKGDPERAASHRRWLRDPRDADPNSAVRNPKETRKLSSK
jgi:tetratricopeptide (TPR) repeat protein